MDTTGEGNKIPEWKWERVYPNKDGIVTIFFNKKTEKQRRRRELNFKLKEFYKGNYGN